MLWKFVRANALADHVLITQIARHTIDPYEGISVCPSEVELRTVQRALGVPLRMARASLIPEPLQRTGSPWLVPILQVVPSWWLPWHRPPVAKGRAVPGSWRCTGNELWAARYLTLRLQILTDV